MFDEPFRQRFGAWASPLAPPLARVGVTPNVVTVLAFIAALAAAALVATGRPLVGIALWVASRIGDGLDGVLARHTGRTSAFGGYLDITLDMAGYAAMVLGFAALHAALAIAWMTVLTGYILVITTTLALSDAARQAGRRASDTDRTFQFTPGYTEAGETTVMYLLWAIFPAHVPWLVWVWVAALGATVVQRTYLAARLLR